jgi:valyl-tRNA synthetase
MDKVYSPALEDTIYKNWENSGAFTPQISKLSKAKFAPGGQPFSIILPPPNANEPLHAGHALYVVEDIMVRYHRMLQDPTLWLPGTDHAGIETQFVFEKKLQKDGKSRFDYDRDTLYKMIADYVDQNSDIAINQLRRLGFSLDWSRLRFANEPHHNRRINSVFKKMHQDGLIYRDEKIVNYCTFCGTAFSNLEVIHKTVASYLWFINYGPLSVATTRPETMLGDTAVAVNPSDPRYKKLIGTKIILPLVGTEIPIIADSSVDPKFGTGAVKVTPSHSPEDYELAKKHNLKFIRIFDYDGRANTNVPQKYQGLFPNQCREAILKDLETAGLLEKSVPYSHEVGHCYKCNRPIEPLTAPQWYVKIKPLAAKAIDAVKKDTITIFPPRFKKEFLRWMKDVRDWNISRQIVWAQRIPVWYNLDDNPNILITFLTPDKKPITDYWKNLQSYKFVDISTGLQTLLVPADTQYYLSEVEAQKNGLRVLQETDVFDTWFSSGQWPYSTLGWEPDGKHSPDFKYFYPTSVLDTMWDILFFWVARMVMMGLYVTGVVPFKVAHMHSRVVDAKGVKMSKSKGNVINPIEIVDKYGADALRMALVFGIAPGSDIPLSDDKVRAQRNFVNKIWNAARFVLMTSEKYPQCPKNISNHPDDKKIIKTLTELVKSTTTNLDKYRFGQASEDLYHFFWHDFCDDFLEKSKSRDADVVPVLLEVLVSSLKLLHPFIPFVTETIYQELKVKFNLSEAQLITALWPTINGS